jgi:hypothetical protein
MGSILKDKKPDNRRNCSPRIGRKVLAGKPGTKRMVEKYGDKLVCIRYRYDLEKKIKYKTAEIIVDSGFWDGVNEGKRKLNLRIGFEEYELREKVKAAGGNWNKEKKVWEIDRRAVNLLGLRERVVK